MRKSTIVTTLIATAIMGMTMATVAQADQNGVIINNNHARQITNNSALVGNVSIDAGNTNSINQNNASSNLGKIESNTDASMSEANISALSSGDDTGIINNTTIDRAGVNGISSVGNISLTATAAPSIGGTSIGANNTNSVTAVQTASTPRN